MLKTIATTIVTIVEEDKTTTIQLRNCDNTVSIKESIDGDTQEINMSYEVLLNTARYIGMPALRK